MEVSFSPPVQAQIDTPPFKAVPHPSSVLLLCSLTDAFLSKLINILMNLTDRTPKGNEGTGY